jgi:hypothetical protein
MHSKSRKMADCLHGHVATVAVSIFTDILPARVTVVTR